MAPTEYHRLVIPLAQELQADAKEAHNTCDDLAKTDLNREAIKSCLYGIWDQTENIRRRKKVETICRSLCGERKLSEEDIPKAIETYLLDVPEVFKPLRRKIKEEVLMKLQEIGVSSPEAILLSPFLLALRDELYWDINNILSDLHAALTCYLENSKELAPTREDISKSLLRTKTRLEPYTSERSLDSFFLSGSLQQLHDMLRGSSLYILHRLSISMSWPTEGIEDIRVPLRFVHWFMEELARQAAATYTSNMPTERSITFKCTLHPQHISLDVVDYAGGIEPSKLEPLKEIAQMAGITMRIVVRAGQSAVSRLDIPRSQEGF